MDKIISLDETSISPSLIMEYSKCLLGKRCVVKTDDNYFFNTFFQSSLRLSAYILKPCIGCKNPTNNIKKNILTKINTPKLTVASLQKVASVECCIIPVKSGNKHFRQCQISLAEQLLP